MDWEVPLLAKMTSGENLVVWTANDLKNSIGRKGIARMAFTDLGLIPNWSVKAL
jgi:hypothetical protein